MKSRLGLLALFSFLFILTTLAQENSARYEIKLQNRRWIPEEGITSVMNDQPSAYSYNGVYYLWIQFYELPDLARRKELENRGIQLGAYLPEYTYIARCSRFPDEEVRKQFGIRSLIVPRWDDKVSQEIALNEIPPHALQGERIMLSLLFYPGSRFSDFEALFDRMGVEIFDKPSLLPWGAHLSLSVNDLEAFAALPFVWYIQPIAGPDETNNERVNNHQNVGPLSDNSGLKLTGKGITVGVGDGGFVRPHADFGKRLQNNIFPAGFGTHQLHVSGTIGGAGWINPLNKGAAPASSIWADFFYDIIVKTPALQKAYNLSLTNNSYEPSGASCATRGLYGYQSQELDYQLELLPQVSHQFAAANSGTTTCAPYPAGFKTLSYLYGPAKNVITIGSVDANGVVSSFSSRGPATDGRLKPEISGIGSGVTSTWLANGYSSISGTSMATPGITGIAALLSESYKNLHNDSLPEGILLKAAMMNTARDVGNPGPDFTYGYGWVNSYRAELALREGRYTFGSVDNGDSIILNLPVAANTPNLKVLLAWRDPYGNPSAPKMLVNNLDLYVITPSSAIVRPWVLNTTPANVNDHAVQGIDSLNNAEQVTIANPSAGTYKLVVKGTSVPFGPQRYALTWEAHQPFVKITFPTGDTAITRSTNITVRWDAEGLDAETFTLQHSNNGGASWTTASSAIPGTDRTYTWNSGTTHTKDFLLRIYRNSSLIGDTSDSKFSVFRTMTALTIDRVCPDTLQVSFSAVSGASQYRLYYFNGSYMDSTALFSGTTGYITGHYYLDTMWIAARAYTSAGVYGPRSVAIRRNPGLFSCAKAFNDVELRSIISPTSRGSYDCDSVAVNVTVRVRNNGTSTLTNLPLSFQFNNQTVVSQTFSLTLATGAETNLNFTTKIDAANEGQSQIKIWSNLGADAFRGNDTLSLNFIGGQGTLTNLEEDFEAVPTSYTNAADCGQLFPNVGKLYNSLADSTDWRIGSGYTPSGPSGTGPSGHIWPDSAYFGNYLFIEATNCTPNRTAVIQTPCMDLSQKPLAYLLYFYHMYGSNMGSLRVQADTGTGWITLQTITGNQGNSWYWSALDLNAYRKPKVRFRLLGTTGNGFRSDIALDGIAIRSADKKLWIGNDTIWTNAINWLPPGVPNATHEVLLPGKPWRGKHPWQHSAVDIKAIEIEPNANLRLNGNYMRVRGDFISSGNVYLETGAELDLKP